MKLVILTSNHLRHKYFVNALAEHFEVAGVITEEKKRDPSKKGDGTKDELEVKEYFSDREKSEEEFFGSSRDLKIPSENIKNIIAGHLNESDVISQIKVWSPDYICVFGSSLIGKEIIDLYRHKIFNMHLGLSPYYRGSGTNFWPLYENKPEYVGVTIHYIDEGIDTGEIIGQARPSISLNDTPHSIGNKTIEVGVKTLIKILKKIEKGEVIQSYKQDRQRGKVYLFDSCKSEHIIDVGKRFKNGSMKNILREANDKKIDIIEM